MNTQNETDVLDVLAKLPAICFSRLPSNENQVIAVKRGVMGYWPINTDTTPEDLNANRGITLAQVQAMLAGSMFGWEVPAANPDNYDDAGKWRGETAAVQTAADPLDDDRDRESPFEYSDDHDWSGHDFDNDPDWN